MLQHLLKLIWSRKKANALIITEVLICFIVAFSILTTLIYNYRLQQTPLGFEWQNMWRVSAVTVGNWDNDIHQPQIQKISEMLNSQPEIVGAKVIRTTPFAQSRSMSIQDINDVEIRYMNTIIEPGGNELLNMELIEGRWFNEEDRGQNYRPILIDQRFKDLVYPNESAIGKNTISEESIKEGATPTKIVGVFKAFRQMGEFSELIPYLFNRYDIEKGQSYPITNFMVKMQEGVTAAYEEDLAKLLNSIAPEWSFRIENWKKLRDTHHRNAILPMSILSIVSVFLMLMVGLGLFGVLWQNVTRRTQEIGLRRAMGATNNSVYSQITGELLVVTLFGLIIGTIIVVQFPLLGVISNLDWTTFWLGHIAAVTLMFLLALICAFYPSKVATNYSPAMALHYE